MKSKMITVVLCILITASVFSATVYAKTPLSITRQPQNSSFPENASAMWSVEAEGENLVYDWFIVYNGVAYNTKKSFSENHPWQEGITGDGYGSNDAGNVFFINGIGKSLNGAEIYCVVSDGTYSVTSSSAYITVGTPASPPEIHVPAHIETEAGSELKLTCQATASKGDSISSYLWYETTTGEFKDIAVIGAKEGQEQTKSVLVCNTSEIGTRYYVCAVTTKKGGFAYSGVIAVSVKKAEAAAPGGTSNIPDSTAAKTQPSGTSNIPDGTVAKTQPSGTAKVTESSDPSDTLSDTEPHTENNRLSLPAIVLTVFCGVAVIGGVTAAILIKKKNK